MEIPKEYPAKLSTEDLIIEIEKYSQLATNASRSKNYSLGPAYWREISVLGQNELNLRLQKELQLEITNLRNEIAELKINNKRSSRQSLILTITTVLIACITLFIGYKTLSFSEADQDSDEKWREEQIHLLRKGNELIEKNNMKLDTVIKQKITVTKKNE